MWKKKKALLGNHIKPDCSYCTRGSGFDYAYRYPGMNKVLQAAGRVIRTPRDKGVVLLIDNRFAMPDYRRLMPPHWSHLKMIYDTEKLERELWRFWEE